MSARPRLVLTAIAARIVGRLLLSFALAAAVPAPVHAGDASKPTPIAAAPGTSASSPAEKPLVRIGTTESSLSPKEKIAVSKTFLYLSRRLPQYRFEIRNYPVSNLEIALKTGELDLFLASSGFYRRVFHRGLRDLVTMTSVQTPDPGFAAGSLFLVRKDSPYRHLKDLKGARAAVSWSEGFTGYFLPAQELHSQGFSAETFFSTYVWGGSPTQRLLESLLEGKADVAFARACTYEELAEQNPEFASFFRPIHVKSDLAPGFQCASSTELLPNWTIVSTALAPWQVSRDVTVALLDMPATAEGYAWGVVSDFARVDDMYRELKAGPYAYLKIRSLQDFVQRFWPFFVIALLTILGLVLHSWRSGVLVRKRTMELQAAMESERAAQRMALEERRQRELLEQVSVIGAMSSLITHELNAPLNAISNTTHSLERFFENHPSPSIVHAAVGLIRNECDRAAGIVRHVRSYVKRREILREPVDLHQVLCRVVRDEGLKHPSISIRLAVSEGSSTGILADALEMELAFSNLVRNAADAVRNTPDPFVELKLMSTAQSVVVSIRDNGADTRSGDEVRLQRSAIESSKPHGLGLGLLIVRTIIERHAGHLDVRWADPGLKFIVTLPKKSGATKK